LDTTLLPELLEPLLPLLLVLDPLLPVPLLDAPPPRAAIASG
jgi:hypothetical protein